MKGLGTRVGDAGGASGKCDHPPTDSVQSANVRRYRMQDAAKRVECKVQCDHSPACANLP